MTPIVSKVFTLPVRIYYEDTDAGGVVYHASYIRFMERARTEWLRQLGYDQTTLLHSMKIAFVVRSLTVDYLKPAYFDDLVQVSVQIQALGRASITFTQTITREQDGNTECLISASVKVVCVQVDKFKSIAIPNLIRSLLDEC